MGIAYETPINLYAPYKKYERSLTRTLVGESPLYNKFAGNVIVEGAVGTTCYTEICTVMDMLKVHSSKFVFATVTNDDNGRYVVTSTAGGGYAEYTFGPFDTSFDYRLIVDVIGCDASQRGLIQWVVGDTATDAGTVSTGELVDTSFNVPDGINGAAGEYITIRICPSKTEAGTFTFNQLYFNIYYAGTSFLEYSPAAGEFIEFELSAPAQRVALPGNTILFSDEPIKIYQMAGTHGSVPAGIYNLVIDNVLCMSLDTRIGVSTVAYDATRKTHVRCVSSEVTADYRSIVAQMLVGDIWADMLVLGEEHTLLYQTVLMF